ncbi:MAG: SUMF1/EgtB/PvdO family nonheme iron enzyme [Candidatus Riflebacteria bacterium]|nr:SUMF1/EgtB/PvdO family nonheme iron enzyme [Candidatus Riflebacteria bacterium]
MPLGLVAFTLGLLSFGTCYLVGQRLVERTVIVPPAPAATDKGSQDQGGPASPVTTRPAAPLATPPSGPPTSPAGQAPRRYALIVGVSKYTAGMGQLAAASDDARLIRQTLSDRRVVGEPYEIAGFFEDERATPGPIIQLLGTLNATITARDTFLFFFSGHGMKRGDETYLALSSWSSQSADPANQGISLSALRRALQNLRCRTKVVILDSCYSGGLHEQGDDGLVRPAEGRLGQADVEGLVKGLSPQGLDGVQPRVVALTSSLEYQESYENDRTHQGYFTEALVEGLKGRGLQPGEGGAIHIAALYRHVNQQVPRRVERDRKRAQVPDISLRGTTGDDIVLGHVAVVPGSGSISVDSDPPGAEICDPDTHSSYGVTPKVLWNMAAGALKLELVRPGYREEPLAVTVVSGCSTSVTKTLVSLASLGAIELRSDPPGARIFDVVRRRDLGQTNTTIQRLEPGALRLSLSLPDHRPQEVTGLVESGKTSQIRVRLTTRTVDDGRVFEPDREEMVLVAGGEFVMGAGDQADASPPRVVQVDAFHIDKHEVTNGRFRRFVEATGYKTEAERIGTGEAHDGKAFREVTGADWRRPRGPGSSIEGLDDHPVVQVSWNDAVAFCRWAGKRLPTEAEWEKASRGGGKGQRFPWEGPDDPSRRCFGLQDDAGPARVGSFPPNRFGLSDMAGNVWEWCADWYDRDYHRGRPSKNPRGPASGVHRCVRGGSWRKGDPQVLECANRGYNSPAERSSNFGFRCVRPVPVGVAGAWLGEPISLAVGPSARTKTECRDHLVIEQKEGEEELTGRCEFRDAAGRVWTSWTLKGRIVGRGGLPGGRDGSGASLAGPGDQDHRRRGHGPDRRRGVPHGLRDRGRRREAGPPGGAGGLLHGQARGDERAVPSVRRPGQVPYGCREGREWRGVRRLLLGGAARRGLASSPRARQLHRGAGRPSGGPGLLERCRGVLSLGRQASAQRGRMGEGRPGGAHGAEVPLGRPGGRRQELLGRPPGGGRPDPGRDPPGEPAGSVRSGGQRARVVPGQVRRHVLRLLAAGRPGRPGGGRPPRHERRGLAQSPLRAPLRRASERPAGAVLLLRRLPLRSLRPVGARHGRVPAPARPCIFSAQEAARCKSPFRRARKPAL